MGLLKIIIKPEADKDYLKNAVNYIIKNDDTMYYGGINVCPEKAYKQMRAVKKYFGKTSGNQLVHFIVCFSESIYDYNEVKEYAYQIAEYYKSKYQIIFGVHSEVRSNYTGSVKSQFHIHFIMNSVSFKDGKMYAENRKDVYKFVEHIATVTGDTWWRVKYGDNI